MNNEAAIKTNDLTQGDITEQLLRFFFPIAAGTIFQQLYNAVDGMVVGKFVGTEALAAVGGSAANIINVLVGFFVAMTAGASIVISHLYGAKNEEGLSDAANASLALCGAFSVLLMAVGLPFSEAILRWMKTPEDTMDGSLTYVRIYFCGVLFSLIFNMGSGILRAVGDSKRPFYYLMVCCAVNIVLDLIFVIELKMGVAGVALATVISQLVSAVLVIMRLCKEGTPYRINFKKFRLYGEHVPQMLKLGLSAGLQNSMYSVSNMIIQVGVNTLNTATVAAWSLSGKLDGFYWASINAAGTAVMSFVGQNFGAGKIDRIRGCVKKSLKLFGLMTIAFSVVIMLIADKAFIIFSNDPEVRHLAFKVCSYFVPTYIVWSVIEIISGTLRGAGDSIVPTFIAGIGICLFRVLWVILVFPNFHTLLGISICYPVSWVITAIALLIRYSKGRWLEASTSHIKA